MHQQFEDLVSHELYLADRRRRFRHQILRRRGLREGNHVANGFFAGQQHHHAVNSQRDAAMRRSAVGQRVEEKSEALPRFFRQSPSARNSRACNSWL